MAVDPGRVTFLMVGCQRCGTTWTDAALREHPQVYLPPQKQTYFFDRHYDKGFDWYMSQYDGVADETAVGEVATGYCLVEAVPKMAAHLPHVKLIMSMRHPVDRAYSYFLSRRAEFGWSSFEDALAKEPDLKDRGRYIEQIETLLEHYPREKMLFMLYEDLAKDDRAYLRAVLSHLGLNPDFESSEFGQRRNAAMFPRLRKTLHRVGLKPALNALSRSPIGDMVRRSKKRGGKKSADSMNADTRAALLAYFEPYNQRLSEFLGRDLSHWNQ